MNSNDIDIIVIGAGIVGSAFATSLGKQGRKVVVIERDLSEPNRIVGELLQPGGVEHIKTLGLEDCFNNIDSPYISGYAVFNGDDNVELTYPINTKTGKEPFGRSFHHGRFIQQLRKSASNEKNVTLIQGTVIELIEEKNSITGVTYKNGADIHNLYAKLIVICDGIFSKFRKDYIKKKPISNSSFVGFVVSDIDLPFPNKGHVFFNDESPTLCYPISSTEARFLVDIPNPIPSNNGNLAKYLLDNVANTLPEPIKQGVIREIQSGKIRSMPCSRLHPEYYKKEGIVILGDAWNIRHPITGAGMTVALSDVVLLTNLFKPLSFKSSKEISHVIQNKFYKERIRQVGATNVLAEAIYQVFAGRAHMKAMQQAIFAYFKLGPKATTTPISLLACLETNPLLLIFHFFIVAIYGSLKIILSSPLSFITAIRVIITAALFFLPLLYNEHILSI